MTTRVDEFMELLFGLVVGAFIIGGWIANLVKLVDGLSEPVTGMFIARGVGVFIAPIGVILGYF